MADCCNNVQLEPSLHTSSMMDPGQNGERHTLQGRGTFNFNPNASYHPKTNNMTLQDGAQRPNLLGPHHNPKTFSQNLSGQI